ncbi:SpoIVB peptidase S55 domain-containing protein [Halanaerobium hydrogeniformans]|uniref:Peptidase S55 domain-containing protein n=1 Tax=Halanaerobium hydrogeniformans TaxID=656519 RepID=E4RP62_HALHG|nr:SpoIVB peptidase S55 domain-containing protein [Halanaerobium hydrogeniformans]ADQ13887.1 hypothetical protein Halsa_0412 [Halanaerobium hydrogeniformans]
MKNKKVLFVFLLTIIMILSLSLAISAAENIMPLEDIEAGMSGYGRTVFRGTEIEEFPVEIISVTRNRNFDHNLILIKVSGDKIEAAGGVASGMSGSPIYVDDKLIGAIGYGWNFSDHRYGLVTPIERMLDLLEDKELDEDEFFDEEFEGEVEDQFEDEIESESLSLSENLARTNTPLMVSGMSGRALKRLEEDMEELDLEVVVSPGVMEEEEDLGDLQAGDAVAVQLVRGDINVGSTGTVSYVDDNQIIAFAHQFTNRGEVNYLLSRAFVHEIIPSLQAPFKMSSPYQTLIGSITQDRNAGIAGQVGQFPRIIPLYVSISEDGVEKKEVSLQIINDETLFPGLANSAALQSIDAALDRIGSGTARSRLKVMGRGLPGLQVESTDMYYSRNDIAMVSLNDFAGLINLITTNPFKEINLIDVRLEIDIDKSDSVALIQEAEVLNDEIYPGDELEVEVTLHRYRDGTETKIVKLQLPDDVEPGLATLFVDGGFTGETARLEDSNQLQSSSNGRAEISGHTSFESMLQSYLDSPDNNDLILQLYPAFSRSEYLESSDQAPGEAEEIDEEEIPEPEREPENDEEVEKPQEISEEDEIKQRYPTDYVLEGSLNLDIEILALDEDTETDDSEITVEEETEVEVEDEISPENEEDNDLEDEETEGDN